jgi:hypothetical protein
MELWRRGGGEQRVQASGEGESGGHDFLLKKVEKTVVKKASGGGPWAR